MRRHAARWSVALVSQALTLLLAACSSGGNDADPTPPPPPPADTTAPTVPQGVTATAQSTTQIALTWTASTDAGAGVAGYRVFRDASAAPLATVTVTNYTDTNLTAGTTYSYTVRAFDAATPENVSAPSAAVDGTTNAPPTAGSGLDARPANATCLAGDAPSTAVTFL